MIYWVISARKGSARTQDRSFIQASWETAVEGPSTPAHPHQLTELHLFFLCLSLRTFGPDLGISVGALTLPRGGLGSQPGVFKAHCDPLLPPIFHGEAGKPGKHPSPHRSTSPLPCVGCPRGSENIPVSRHLHQIRVRRRQELVAALGGLTCPPRPPSVARPSCPHRPHQQEWAEMSKSQ